MPDEDALSAIGEEIDQFQQQGKWTMEEWKRLREKAKRPARGDRGDEN